MLTAEDARNLKNNTSDRNNDKILNKILNDIEQRAQLGNGTITYCYEYNTVNILDYLDGIGTNKLIELGYGVIKIENEVKQYDGKFINKTFDISW